MIKPGPILRQICQKDEGGDSIWEASSEAIVVGASPMKTSFDGGSLPTDLQFPIPPFDVVLLLKKPNRPDHPLSPFVPSYRRLLCRHHTRLLDPYYNRSSGPKPIAVTMILVSKTSSDLPFRIPVAARNSFDATVYPHGVLINIGG